MPATRRRNQPYALLPARQQYPDRWRKPWRQLSKQVREKESNSSNGGIRSHDRAQCVNETKALALGKRLRQSILQFIRKDTSLLEQTVDMLQGKSCTTTTQLPTSLRAELAQILGVEPPADKGISPEFIKGFCDQAGDPDGILAEWRIAGAPLGMLNEITATGIFPTVALAESTKDPSPGMDKLR
jgi:hypothetical protein